MSIVGTYYLDLSSINTEENISFYAEEYDSAYNEMIKKRNTLFLPGSLYAGIWILNVWDLNNIIKKHNKIYLDADIDEIKLNIKFQ